MLGKDKRSNDSRTTEGRPAPAIQEKPIRARGGVSLLAVLTGAFVAIGSIFLLSAAVGVILEGVGISAEEAEDSVVPIATALGIALFLAFLWGGYTAGRMARGSGFVNGLLVPIMAFLLIGIVAALGLIFDTTTGLDLPFVTNEVQIGGEDQEVTWGLIGGLVALAAIFLGSILGGLLGSRWHTKLERRSQAEVEERNRRSYEQAQSEQADRDREQRSVLPPPTATPPPAYGGAAGAGQQPPPGHAPTPAPAQPTPPPAQPPQAPPPGSGAR